MIIARGQPQVRAAALGPRTVITRHPSHRLAAAAQELRRAVGPAATSGSMYGVSDAG
jgi:hypothetical protein